MKILEEDEWEGPLFWWKVMLQEPKKSLNAAHSKA